MSERFGYTSKEKREIRQKLQNDVSKAVYLKSIAEKMTATDKYDSNIFEKGINWFNEGMSLEEAPDNIKNNTNFIRGYERAKRLALIEGHLYDLGKKYFEDGLEIENIPLKYRNSDSVIKGYNDAKDNNKGRK